MADGDSPQAPGSVRRKKRWRRVTLLVVLLGLAAAIYFATRPPTIHPGTVLTLHIGGELPEVSPDNPIQALARAFGGEQRLTLHDLRRVLQHARRDSRIKGVVLEITPIHAGWAKVEELRDLIASVREAGKPVHALVTGDFIQEKEYLLGAAADRVVASPESGLLLNGLVAEVMFYRGLFDRVGVEPQFLQFKEYKSAAEPFIHKAMSPPMREVVTGMLQGINDRFVSYVAERRKIDAAALRKLMDRGGQTTGEAVAARLLDGVGYRDEVEAGLRGPDKGPAEQRRLTASGGRYREAIGDDPPLGQVALIYGVGPITAGGDGGSGLSQGEVIEGPKLARAVREAANDDSIKAIVLRVDSPGGSAVGSDFVWREVERAKARKPVVVSMSDVAGSGGYWISMAATAIVAQPSTLTGSIGVVYGSFNVMPPLTWAGLTVDTVKFGENADLLSPYRSRTPAQLQQISAWMQQVYDDFVGKVARGRGLDAKAVEPLAHGRVWLGSEAQPRKLVDQLGGLELALRIAREKAGLKPDPAVEPVLFPKQRGLLGALSRSGALAPTLARAAALVDASQDPAALQAALQALARELGTPRPYAVAPTLDIH